MSYYDREKNSYREDADSYRRSRQHGAYPADDYYRSANSDYYEGYERRQPSGPHQPPPKKSLSRNAKIGIGAAAVVVVFGVGLSAGGGGSTGASGTNAANAANTGSGGAEPPAAAGSGSGSIPAGQAPATQAPATQAPPPAARKALPNVVGMNHQAAQDTLQAAGFYYLAEEDATGQGRMLLWDRNWLVVSQTPAAGTVLSTDQQVMLRSKKDTDP